MLLSSCTSCSRTGNTNTGDPTGGGGGEPPAHEHVWGSPTYEWAADYSSCTAQRVCLTDSEHTENETATSTYDVISEPRCETDGLGRYTVTFQNVAFSNQTHDETIDAIGHNYVFDSIVWTGFDAQAKYVCSHDSSHVQYHNATVTSEVTTSPLCESSGIRTYVASYDGHSDTKTEVLSPLGHNWGNPTYVWSVDHSSCTAERVCLNDSSHKQTETVDSIYNVTVNATCESDGTGRYTTSFTNSAFSSQTYDTVLAALGHDYQFDSIVWTGFDAQAKYVCSHDPYHVEYHNATVTSEVTTSPSCESSGIRTYTASYDGHSDTKTEVLSSLGHNWGSTTYAWASDYSSCTATRVCNNDSSHIETETVDSTYAETIPPTYEADGEGTYTATFANEAFETQVVNITIDQLVRYNGEIPVLSDDGRTITYGLYPQTNVNDTTLVSALNDLTTSESNGWYLYNGEYYAKTSANPYFSSYKFDNGVTIVKGTNYWFKCEPIVWNVLSNTSGVYSVVSSVLLDAQCFYGSLDNRTVGSNTIFPNNYEYSDIRTWLNSDFYDAAFALDDSNIQITTVDNSKTTTDSKYNSYACKNTQDNVYLLSYKDYLTTSYGFSSSTGVDSSRTCRTTDWARARGAWYQGSGQNIYNGYYITRSPYSGNQKTVWWVDLDGTFYSGGSADSKAFSIRPGISIKIA